MKNIKLIIILALLLSNCTRNIQEQINLNGVWQSSIWDYYEFWGEYNIYQNLTIQDNNYIWEYKIIKEFGPFSGETLKGTVKINNNKIIFTNEERLGAWSDDWEPKVEENIYSYFIENNILVLIEDQENKSMEEIIIFEKDEDNK